MRGWISLHRQILENEFWLSEKFTKSQAWIDLLLLATHKPTTVYIRGIEINLKPGELCWSQLSLAKRWKWNRKTVSTYLSMLSQRQMLDIKISKVTSIISIKNWSKYQNTGQQNGQQKDNRTDTNNNVNHDNNGNKREVARAHTQREDGIIKENINKKFSDEVYVKAEKFKIPINIIKRQFAAGCIAEDLENAMNAFISKVGYYQPDRERVFCSYCVTAKKTRLSGSNNSSKNYKYRNYKSELLQNVIKKLQAEERSDEKTK